MAMTDTDCGYMYMYRLPSGKLTDEIIPAICNKREGNRIVKDEPGLVQARDF